MKSWFTKEMAGKMKQGLRQFWGRNGFALVLLLCAGVIGAAALLAPQEEPAPSAALPTPTPIAPRMALATPSVEWIEPVAAQTPQPASELLSYPLLGTEGMPFAMDELLYQRTLGEWRSHEGMDILAPEGTEVKAAMDGEVIACRAEDSWGHVVTIRHEDGLTTGYASLKEILVEQGAKVSRGQVIGTVGISAGIELEEGPHLHFFLQRHGVPINPQSLLP